MSKIQDSVEANNLFRRLDEDQRARRDQYWNALFAMRKEYLEENKGVYDLTSRPTVHYWAEMKYGFKMGIDSQGDYTKDYEVVDPKRFMLFQIKFMK